MRKLLEQISRELRAFVDQRDDLVLLTACADDDTAILLKTMRDIEQSGEGDMMLMFADEFVEPVSYVEQVMERLRAEHCIADEQLEQDGEEPMPPMPEELLDEERPPQQRLFEAATWARSLLPRRGGHLLIFVLCPTRIADRAAWLQLINIFLPWELKPWMRGGYRFIFRDLPVGETVGAEVSAPRTRVLPVNLGQDAIEDSLADEALDESLPLERRLQSLLMLSIMDMAHGRKTDVMAKSEILLANYQLLDDARGQALVYNNLGDMHHHHEKDKLPEAQKWYECAVPLANEVKDPVLLYTVVSNLGDVTYKQQLFPMAEELYRHADDLAAKMGNPEARVLSLERLGLSQEHQQKFTDAMTNWQAAVKLCDLVGEMDPYRQANQGHLDRVRQKARQAAARPTGPQQPQQPGVTGPHPIVPGVPQPTGPQQPVQAPQVGQPGATGSHPAVSGNEEER